MSTSDRRFPLRYPTHRDHDGHVTSLQRRRTISRARRFLHADRGRPWFSRCDVTKRTLAVGASTFLVCAGLCALAPTAAQAASRTLLVPGKYHTISTAVAAARNGDTVLVSPGTYRENVTINAKYVVLRAASANPAATVIIGRAGRTPVMIANVPVRRGTKH